MNTLHEEFVDQTVANLKVIGMLQRNDKLRVHKGQLCIDHHDGALQSVRRWLYRDSRDVTLIQLRNTVSNAIRIARAMTELVGAPEGAAGPLALISARAAGADAITADMREWTLGRLVDEMASAQLGLQNLRATYAGDSSFVASLDVLAERLHANSVKLGGAAPERPPPQPPVSAPEKAPEMRADPGAGAEAHPAAAGSGPGEQKRERGGVRT